MNLGSLVQRSTQAKSEETISPFLGWAPIADLPTSSGNFLKLG